MGVQIINADALAGLAQIPDKSVHCVVTSPPYWGLRDYGVEGQIGLETTPEAFVARLVEVFREVRRVLRKDGVLFLNLGDSYAGSWGAQSRGNETGESKSTLSGASMLSARQIKAHPKGTLTGSLKNTPGLKPKDLVGIPWMVAFALRADGWWLRQEIIWHKPNPMPESVTDRCTKAHEHIFLLSKSERYFFDANAIREAAVATSITSMDGGPQRKSDGSNANNGRNFRQRGHERAHEGFNGRWDAMPKSEQQAYGRNKRSVWSIATTPYGEAHFATFPEELPEICIKAGCPAGGTVLDPFGGAGTTGLVADKLGRNAILIELNPEYAAMAERRIFNSCPLFAEVASVSTPEQMTIFNGEAA